MPRLWEMVLGLATYERMLDAVTGNAGQLARDLFDDPPCIEGLVLEEGGALHGYALFYPTYSSFRSARMLWLEDLYVDPAARGRGYGQRLLAALAELAVSRGVTRVDWAVLDWNAPACSAQHA
jgi:GNAT superfamily N-acetyltransferase